MKPFKGKCPCCGAIDGLSRITEADYPENKWILKTNYPLDGNSIWYCTWCLFPTVFDEEFINLVLENPNGKHFYGE